MLTTHIDKDHVHNHLIFNAVDFVDHHAYKSYKKIYYDMREVSDRLCKENGLSVIPPSQGKGMSYKEYTEAKRGTSWKQKLKQTIDRNIITAKDYDEKFYDWATSTQISRMSSLTSFGASSEVAEVAQEYMDEKAPAHNLLHHSQDQDQRLHQQTSWNYYDRLSAQSNKHW